MINEIVFFDTLRQGLWIAVITSFPILAVALGAGLVVGLFQALTSIQELTLTFVPKLAAICPSSDNLGQLSGFCFGGSGSSLIEFMLFQFGGASAA